MKILLIYPYFLEERLQADDIRPVPMGMYSIAAMLRDKGYDVEILNWHDMGKRPEEVKATLVSKKADLIGISILHANRWGGIEIARMAQKIDPGVRIVFGGIGASFLWKHLLTHFPEIDIVVMGEGEYTFLNLIQWIQANGDRPPEGIRGIAFKAGGKIIKTEDADFITDLDALPNPARYYTYQHLSTARGCAWACNFCGSPAFWRGRVRLRSPGHVIEELETLYKKGISFFYFSDDTLTLQKKRVIDICKGIIERKLQMTWFAISRVDLVDEEILFWMRKAGCIQLSYGIESGSEKIRASLNKRVGTEQIRRAFSLTTRYGILSRAYFIYGGPGEGWDTIQETVDLILEIKPLSAIFYILDIFPGTDLWADCKRRLGLSDDIWLEKIEGIMYSETVPQMSDELILFFGKRLREAFYTNVHHFAEDIELVDKKELYESHADFLSRLGMTFLHGDYSRSEAVKDKEQTAESLFRRSLDYFPDHRAYLGLGILYQKRGQDGMAKDILTQGLHIFGQSKELNLCLGISFMNLEDYDRAFSIFSQFPESKRARDYLLECTRILGHGKG